MIEKKMAEINAKIFIQAKTVESMLNLALKGVFNRDSEACQKVLEMEKSVNRMEIDIDELCTTVLALYQPEAAPLRKIITILKNNNDLERIGDHAVNICESAAELKTFEKKDVYQLLHDMSDSALLMFSKAFLSFMKEDPALARDVCSIDDSVDEIEMMILKRSLDVMASEPGLALYGYHMIRIAQNLERIADLSTNMAEETVFMKEGRILRHGKDESLGAKKEKKNNI
jgi:phosphate transport system protein